MKTKYHSKNHSKFLIKLHFVFAVKYRKKLLIGKLNDDMLQIIFEICKEKGYVIDAMQSDIDHLHILVDIEPKVSALEVAHQIKQISTFRIYKKHKDFLKKTFLERKYILFRWLFRLFNWRCKYRNNQKVHCRTRLT